MVVDDGSTEAPVTLKKYVAQYPNIHYHRQENAGVSTARNTGMDLATGEWIYFCDSDDFVQRQVLGKLLDIADIHQLDMLFAHIVNINPQDPVPAPRLSYNNLSVVMTGLSYIAAHPVMQGYGTYQYLMRHAFMERNQLRFRTVNYPEDRFFLIDGLFKAERVQEVDVDLYYYVQRDSSIMHAQRRRYYEERYSEPVRTYLSWLSDHIANPQLPEDVRHSLYYWRDINSYNVLLDSFRYASVPVLKETIDLLSRLGVYPLLIRGDRKTVLIRRWMNSRRLWVLGARLYHVLPASVRERH